MAKERPSRWLQLSMSTLFVVLTFCAVGLAWLNDRRQLLEKIEELEAFQIEVLVEALRVRINPSSDKMIPVRRYSEEQ